MDWLTFGFIHFQPDKSILYKIYTNDTLEIAKHGQFPLELVFYRLFSEESFNSIQFFVQIQFSLTYSIFVC